MPFLCQKTPGDVTQIYQLSCGLPLPQTLVSSSPFHLILLTCTQIKDRSQGEGSPWVGFWEENKSSVNHYENNPEVMALSIMLLGFWRNSSLTNGRARNHM